jgi:membrane-associated protease RseP (regulator of RpoE activity)
MVLISIIIVVGSIAAIDARARPMPPEQILALPGLNPLIPLWYGIFALAIAVIIHEFAHGILARFAKIKLKSLGILLFIVPVGAFVEPDEKKMETTKKSNRVKIFSAGPATNIMFGLFCAMIFSWCFMASLSPIEDGVIIFKAYEGPAQFSSPDIEPGMEIIDINGEPIDDYWDYYDYNGSAPNETISLGIYYKGDYRRIENITSGLTVLSLLKDYPAHDAGIEPGMIIAEVDGHEIRNHRDFSDYMDTTKPDQVISMTVLEYQDVDNNNSNGDVKGMYFPIVVNVTLADKYEYFKDKVAIYEDEIEVIENTKGKGYLGITTSYLALDVRDVNDFSDSLAYPVMSADSSYERRSNIFQYAIGLPMDLRLQILPFHSPIIDIYEVEGPLGVLPNGLFWIMANAFYYLFWINILVGTFNALPMKPLDGGYVFKDAIDSIIKRVKKGLSEAKREKYVNLLSNFIAFFFFLLILWTLIIPWIL